MATLRSLLLLFLSCFCMQSLFSSYAETLIADMKQGQQLSDLASDHLVSDNGFYKLGFFSPGSVSDLGATTNRFLGIWYSKLPNHPDAIWVGNLENPINDSSAVFMLDNEGKLKIVYDGGLIYLSDVNQTISGNVTVSLLGTGNLVLRELDSNGAPGSVIWESFRNATNTLLPGMKLGRNIKTGENWTITSWLSDQSPVPGAFKLGVDPSGADELIVWRREEVYWRSGVWENGNFQQAPDLTKRDDLFWFTFVSTSEEKYFSYYLKNNLTLDEPENNTTISRWELNAWGQILQSVLSANGSIWETTAIGPCIFNPKYPDAVCIEEEASECRNGSELFVRTKGYLNGTESTHTDNSTNLTLSDCHATCWSDCTCIGYEAMNKNGSGCRFYKEGVKFVRSDYFGVAYLLTIATKDGSSRKRWWMWCITGILIGVALLLASYLCYSYKKKIKLRLGQQTDTAKVETSQDHRLLELGHQTTGIEEIYRLKIGKRRGQEFKMYSFSEIVAATDEFSFASKLGEGGFGPVYKGVLPGGEEVAVKRLSRHSGQGLEEFMNEITLIAELQHSNLVQLLGCCIQGEEKILIYEFMTNTSLDAVLFDSIRGKLLDWPRRVNIIEGVAQGLLYLHKYSRVRVIHRDLKPSNILLDGNMNPKISDFGMARIFTQNESRANTNRVVGTYGYMSPEYAMNGIFSEKSDVYSFGVLLLEIVSGKKNTIFVSSTALSLIELAWNLWKQGDSRDLADTSLDSCPKDQVSKFVHVGLLCVQEHAMDRPTMSEVISMLTSDIMFLPDPKQPAYGTSRSEAGSSLPDGRSDIESINGVSITVMEAR
ncbi:G-type lectin S-receptor-like serine/threonine-protein kinase B120 [Argentina anserina]|uniref:G-type lectin S-receptor-like serine/threonine-protein kinase B120 n=1 Tax=Argentina anserina TaxID=57926 RepID=UPI0021764744|nr:G-type lectin S-receptor-like serine/threonine-protein kinase B120 [Potentilla anserina]